MEEYLYDSLYFAVSKLNRNITRIADDLFKPVGMPPSHGILMMLLDEWKELTPGELSKSLDFKPSTTTRFLDKLEEQKYVKRRFDGRFSYVSLTHKGEQKIPEIKGVFEELEYALNRLVTSKISNKQKPVFHDMASAIQEKQKK
jgi:DNA-binding MarR family transcriptional regulator